MRRLSDFQRLGVCLLLLGTLIASHLLVYDYQWLKPVCHGLAIAYGWSCGAFMYIDDGKVRT